MNWYPNKREGLIWGLGLLLALVLAEASIVRSMLGAPLGTWLFLRALLLLATLPLLAFLAYGYWGLANLTYRIERNGILIRCAASADLVPMGEIIDIVPLTALTKKLVQGVGWPGYRLGQVQLAGVGPLWLYVTRPPEQCLVIRTRTRGYVISPANIEGFLADYRARRKLKPIAAWAEGRRLPGLLGLELWHDRLAGVVALPSLLLNLGLFGYLAARYSALPLRLVLSYDLLGLGDRVGAREELFILPAVGLGVLLVNGALAAWLHRRERVLALLLLGNVPVVQALVWLAAVRFAH